MLPSAGVKDVIAKSLATVTLQSALPNGGTMTDTAASPMLPGPTVQSRVVALAELTVQKRSPTYTCRPGSQIYLLLF